MSWALWVAMPICLRLLEHFMRAAASRTFCTAGSRRPIRMAMMAITTSNSISVRANRRGKRMAGPSQGRENERELKGILPGQGKSGKQKDGGKQGAGQEAPAARVSRVRECGPGSSLTFD